MSGIVGFVNLDREPADPEILSGICRPLKDRAPDGTNFWKQGNVGLGHALLAISPEDSNSSQPFTLDGSAWVTSDAHLCGRAALVEKLSSAGRQVTIEVAVPELLLSAYRAFGEGFAEHLVGDFALAIWDEHHEKLICIRDHLGVRPLFYSHAEGVFVFGSDIDALLAHPKVSDELNETFIADFLLFGAPIEKGATAYKHIKKLPAAHYMVVSSTGIRLHRYWSPPLHQVIRYSHANEYTEHFAAIFEKAVIERIPPTKVALELSGGMDSASIAAVTASHAREHGQEIMAYTNTCHHLIPEDKEGYYAKMIAAQLGISLQLLASEDYPLFDRFDSRALRTPEPFSNPELALHYDKAKQMVDSGCRVLLSGQMGDTLFAGSDTYFTNLAKSGKWARLLADAYVHKKSHGSLTGTGLGESVKAYLRNLIGKKPWQPELPDWLNPEFAERVKLKDRWLVIWQTWRELNDTFGQLQRPWFGSIFGTYEAIKLPWVARHPFSDIRLVEFMLCTPNYMHYNKRVLREAMQARLPAEILARAKEGLPGDVFRAKMESGLSGAASDFAATSPYIDRIRYNEAYKRYLRNDTSRSTWATWLINNPIALAHWMNNNESRFEE